MCLLDIVHAALVLREFPWCPLFNTLSILNIYIIYIYIYVQDQI